MIRICQPIVVEGKYDRLRLQEFIDGTILETGGFTIFKDPDKLALLRTLAAKTGIIVMTDSDAAGFKIRHYLRSAISNGTITDVYIPDILGKERRKAAPSKEGKLGVEGMEQEILLRCLERAGVLAKQLPQRVEPITPADLFCWGLSGQPEAAQRRTVLLKALGFPSLMTTKALLPVLNTLFSRSEFLDFLARTLPELPIDSQ